jgi:glutamine synthetase
MSNLYPTTLSEALPDKERVAEAKARLEEAGVKYFLSCWIDILGLPKTKPVPISEFEEVCMGRGPQFAVHSVSMVPELGPADPDQIPIPDLDSLVICPWDKSCALVFADLFMEDAPYNVCPRLALKRQVKASADAGYAFYAGMEPEFIVMTYDDDGNAIKAFDDDPINPGAMRPLRQAFGYDLEYSIDSMPFLGQLIDILGELSWGLKDVVAEGAYSQFELDFGYSDVLKMADRMTFLRILLKEVAKQSGHFVTYMPKPTQGDWRSGAHINLSARSTDAPDVNLFGELKGPWGDATYNAIAGLMKHGAALTAIACSTVNSYKGLIGVASEFEGGTVTWAPTHISYGVNNRSSMLRLPQTRKAIENRAVDMCVNSYLALAMSSAAALEGITQKLDPGPPTNKSLYDLTEAELEKSGIAHLPTNLLEAITAFDNDALAKEVLGPTMHKSFSRYKHSEWDRFHEHVTDWEKREYLRYF